MDKFTRYFDVSPKHCDDEFKLSNSVTGSLLETSETDKNKPEITTKPNVSNSRRKRKRSSRGKRKRAKLRKISEQNNISNSTSVDLRNLITAKQQHSERFDMRHWLMMKRVNRLWPTHQDVIDDKTIGNNLNENIACASQCILDTNCFQFEKDCNQSNLISNIPIDDYSHEITNKSSLDNILPWEISVLPENVSKNLLNNFEFKSQNKTDTYQSHNFSISEEGKTNENSTNSVTLNDQINSLSLPEKDSKMNTPVRRKSFHKSRKAVVYETDEEKNCDIITIAPIEFPRTYFSDKQTDYVKMMLIKEIENDKNLLRSCNFYFNYYNGMLRVTCRGSNGLEWVKFKLPVLEDVTGQKLTAGIASTEATLLVPACNEDPKIIIERIQNQNPELKTWYWKLISSKLNIKKGSIPFVRGLRWYEGKDQLLTIKIDEESKNCLTKIGNNIYFGLDKIKINYLIK